MFFINCSEDIFILKELTFLKEITLEKAMRAITSAEMKIAEVSNFSGPA